MNEALRGILLAGPSYAQTYPPKLGSGLCEYFS